MIDLNDFMKTTSARLKLAIHLKSVDLIALFQLSNISTMLLLKAMFLFHFWKCHTNAILHLNATVAKFGNFDRKNTNFF